MKRSNWRIFDTARAVGMAKTILDERGSDAEKGGPTKPGQW